MSSSSETWIVRERIYPPSNALGLGFAAFVLAIAYANSIGKPNAGMHFAGLAILGLLLDGLLVVPLLRARVAKSVSVSPTGVRVRRPWPAAEMYFEAGKLELVQGQWGFGLVAQNGQAILLSPNQFGAASAGFPSAVRPEKRSGPWGIVRS